MTDDTTRMIEAVRNDGYAVWPGLATDDLLDRLAKAVESLLASEHARRYPKSTRAWDLYLHGGPFIDLVCDPQLAEVFDALLGEGHLLSDLSLNSVNPGQPVDDWHIDYPYTEMSTMLCGATLGVQCVLAISPFTAANGATRLLPGTHHQPRRPSAVQGTPVLFEAEPGTLLIMAAATWHRSGLNTSSQRRDAILLSFVERWIKQMSAPTAGLAHPVPPRLAGLLGLDRPAETINGVPL